MPCNTKEAQAKSARKHYLKNKVKMKARAVEGRKKVMVRNREYVRAYLDAHPCVDCGESDHRVLDFDHVRGEKRSSISDMVRGGHGLVRLKDEISKCEIRCANHHRIKTYETLWAKK